VTAQPPEQRRAVLTKSAGASRLASRSRAGPASLRRLACAPDQMSPYFNADHDPEQTMNPILSMMSLYFRRRLFAEKF
jgi:hypothetical protein